MIGVRGGGIKKALPLESEHENRLLKKSLAGLDWEWFSRFIESGVGMRGTDEQTGSLFSYVDLESRVRGVHPLRLIRGIANAALSDLSRAFDDLYRPNLRLIWSAISSISRPISA